MIFMGLDLGLAGKDTTGNTMKTGPTSRAEPAVERLVMDGGNRTNETGTRTVAASSWFQQNFFGTLEGAGTTPKAMSHICPPPRASTCIVRSR